MTDIDRDAALSLRDLRKSFGPVEIIRGVNLDVIAGERHAIIGPNGAGKSTLFHLVSGQLQPSAGKIALEGHDVTSLAPEQIYRRGLSRSFQITNVFPTLSVFENVRCAVQWSRGLRYAWWSLVDRRADITRAVEEVLQEVGLEERCDVPAGLMTYAEQRALEIGVAIAGGGRVLLLDEPMAGMSRAESERATELIRRVSRNRTLLMIEHDMSVVFSLADRISVLVYGEVIATGTPEAVRADARVQEAYLGKASN
ncbi:MAG: ABC transporter ATP-binding protein [Ramlibacter sp.]